MSSLRTKAEASMERVGEDGKLSEVAMGALGATKGTIHYRVKSAARAGGGQVLHIGGYVTCNDPMRPTSVIAFAAHQQTSAS